MLAGLELPAYLELPAWSFLLAWSFCLPGASCIPGASRLQMLNPSLLGPSGPSLATRWSNVLSWGSPGDSWGHLATKAFKCSILASWGYLSHRWRPCGQPGFPGATMWSTRASWCFIALALKTCKNTWCFIAWHSKRVKIHGVL